MVASRALNHQSVMNCFARISNKYSKLNSQEHQIE